MQKCKNTYLRAFRTHEIGSQIQQQKTVLKHIEITSQNFHNDNTKIREKTTIT